MIDFDAIKLVDQFLVVINAGIAALLGSAIGWERDRAGKSVGPRTMALVGASSAAIVNIGHILGENSQYGDPTRAMHAIITGIGFLGAGLIFQTRDSGTKGVTTAATVFATAAMGCAVGLGFQVASIGLTIIILIVLRSTHMLEITANRRHDDE
jgi:putative Mg2+ transporter-C (MgtC) family protein